MIFESVATERGCRSYLVGCPDTCQALVIDPEASQLDRYLAIAARSGLRIHYVIDSHTHADHFSGSRQLARRLGIPVVMHRSSSAPFVDLRVEDGEMLVLGKLRFRFFHTPGHTGDSMCVLAGDRLFTGDTLLIGATGRTDLPGGNPEALYDSLFGGILKLPPALKIFPAHDYKGRECSSIGDELASNPRLQKRDRQAFVDMMQHLNLTMPEHITEALRTNLTGGKTVAQLLSEAAASVPFMALSELRSLVEAGLPDIILLDVREKEAYDAGHIPGARLLPRGQLELRVNQELPDPTKRILTYCELGRISTLAAATLRELGFLRVVALDGGFQAWQQAGYPLSGRNERETAGG